MNKQTEMLALRAKVSSLDSLGLDDHAWLKWLEGYVSQAHSILTPHSGQAVLTEEQRQTIIRDYTQFGSDQAALDWAHANKIILSKGPWWWLNPDNRTGQIVGLENSHGIPRITNGIDVWIERGDGSTFFGHRDWLRYDRRKADLTKAAKYSELPNLVLDPLSEFYLKLAEETMV